MENIRPDELYHYGRKGMKWYQNIFTSGKKVRTNRKRRKALEKARETKKQKAVEAETVAAKKERILKSRSAKELYVNAHLFTDQELQSAYNRLNLERNIKSLVPAEVTKGQQFVNSTNLTGKNVHDLMETGSKVYNDAAKVYNTFFKGDGKPWPIYGNNDGNKGGMVDKLKKEYDTLNYQKKISDIKKEMEKGSTADVKTSELKRTISDLEERIRELEEKQQD